MRISRALAALTIAILTCTAAQANDITGDELRKALQKYPDVLIEAIKANRKAIFDIINQTGLEEQARVQKEAEEAEKKAYEDSFKNPLKPAAERTPSTLWLSIPTSNALTARAPTGPSRS
jgi:hypothetical protein